MNNSVPSKLDANVFARRLCFCFGFLKALLDLKRQICGCDVKESCDSIMALLCGCVVSCPRRVIVPSPAPALLLEAS